MKHALKWKTISLLALVIWGLSACEHSGPELKAEIGPVRDSQGEISLDTEPMAIYHYHNGISEKAVELTLFDRGNQGIAFIKQKVDLAHAGELVMGAARDASPAPAGGNWDGGYPPNQVVWFIPFDERNPMQLDMRGEGYRYGCECDHIEPGTMGSCITPRPIDHENPNFQCMPVACLGNCDGYIYTSLSGLLGAGILLPATQVTSINYPQ